MLDPVKKHELCAERDYNVVPYSAMFGVHIDMGCVINELCYKRQFYKKEIIGK